jgi:hypothetical protein
MRVQAEEVMVKVVARDWVVEVIEVMEVVRPGG